MKKVIVIRSDSVLIPKDPISEKTIRSLKSNKAYSCTIKESRNPKHHSLIFGLAEFTVTNCQEESMWNNKDAHSLIKAIQLETGLVEYQLKMNGDIVALPKSIAFDNMDEEEFSLVSDSMFYWCSKILGIDKNDLMLNYSEYLSNHKG